VELLILPSSLLAFAVSSHQCPVCGKHWLHHDPKGVCLNRRDGYDRPSQMTCADCLVKAPGSEVGMLLDSAEDVWGVA
jgi:hypothetical protein